MWLRMSFVFTIIPLSRLPETFARLCTRRISFTTSNMRSMRKNAMLLYRKWLYEPVGLLCTLSMINALFRLMC